MFRIFAAILLTMACSIPALAADAPARLSPQEAMTRLKEGNTRFAKGYMTTFPFAELRKATADDQYPIAMVLSCADSRVIPEYIFNQALGDLFVARAAGNTQSAGITGTLEYGAVKMGIPLLVVLGHTDCEAVGLVVNKEETSGNIPALLAPIAPAVAKGAQLAGTGDPQIVLSKSISENVGQSMEDLFKASPAIRRLVREKNLMVVGALYNVESGEVRWFGPHPTEQALTAD